MNVSERIEELRLAKGWSVYKLSSEANLTPSTLANMHARGTSPSIATLENICQALDITLSEFFTEAQQSTTAEDELLTAYRKLTADQQQALLTIVRSMKKQ